MSGNAGSLGNIKSIEIAYEQTKEFIVYESFQTVLIAIMLSLISLRLYKEYEKNMEQNNGRIDFGTYFRQTKLFLIVAFLSSFGGVIFNLVEGLFGELQMNLINDFGGDLSDKSLQEMRDLIQNNIKSVQAAQGEHIETYVGMGVIEFLGTSVSATLMSIGVLIYKYTYTFFILGRYMWLLMLEMIAPIAIMLVIHENTRSYFYTWVKNMLICYLLIPFFLLADQFADNVANFFMKGLPQLVASSDNLTICIVVSIAVLVKIKMFLVVKTKSTQLL